MVDGYAARPKADTLAFLASTRVRAFEENKTKHGRKARRWWVSIAALVIAGEPSTKVGHGERS